MNEREGMDSNAAHEAGTAKVPDLDKIAAAVGIDVAAQHAERERFLASIPADPAEGPGEIETILRNLRRSYMSGVDVVAVLLREVRSSADYLRDRAEFFGSRGSYIGDASCETLNGQASLVNTAADLLEAALPLATKAAQWDAAQGVVEAARAFVNAKGDPGPFPKYDADAARAVAEDKLRTRLAALDALAEPPQ